ncbi:phosphopentomutase [Xanthovirga aplysinae]|uniref:phosphopentomutase n=1 Tax=Xanthovirga aplysinae TaxID=2529853 RepID=UPI0012BC0FA7|nr:phosphopentomutase [Xanthovirga aplysinae]MTI32329.1 phosphopentomutase [Xanthovirga aplysinae]
MQQINRVILLVLDSVGIGFSEDAIDFDDLGANTLGHIADAVGLQVPNMERLGLGNIAPLKGIRPTENPQGAFGMAKEQSKGKDSTTGHWEIAGQILDEPFPVYPNGFPKEIISEFEAKCERKTLGNKVASGTAIIQELGEEHVHSGNLIVYTSADSVFQIAAHEEVVPIKELYRYCQIARDMLKVGRVIARPFVGEKGDYTRTANRRDFSLEPGENILSKLHEAGQEVISVGKIYDLFAGKAISQYKKTASNDEGVKETLAFIKEESKGLIFINLVDFDTLYGHRRDVLGYKNALERFDQQLPDLMAALKDDDLLIITADHGNDPIFKGTDHTREHVPILVAGKKVKPIDLGLRHSFQDIGATVEEILLGNSIKGSFAQQILK